jgi:hypothetical protein
MSKKKETEVSLIYKDISKKIIPDEVLEIELKKLLNTTYNELEIAGKAEIFESNIIDPFSYIFEYVLFGKKNHEDWKKSEILRQRQKEFGNHLGKFHQNIMCSIKDCYEPKEGGVDLINEKKMIVAEIKNKHNSTNADSKAGSFDKLKYELSKKGRENYTAYFVTVVPKKSDDYERQFITTKTKNKSHYREPDERIFTINAELFYKKISDTPHILKSLYQRIPEIFMKIDQNKEDIVKQMLTEKEFNYYLSKAYGK